MANIIQTALAYAADLDGTLTAGPDDATMDALVERVGELLGGLSIGGFVDDLRAEMDRIAERMRDENPRELIGHGPDARISGWLVREIAVEQDAAARTWLRDAQAIMASVAPALARVA